MKIYGSGVAEQLVMVLQSRGPTRFVLGSLKFKSSTPLVK